MAERIVNSYKRLFEVRLLHHYWLDEGAVTFDAILPDTLRQRRLLTYDARTFFAIEPTPATAKLLSGLSCVFKATGIGFVVAAPAGVSILPGAVFEFVLKVIRPDFFNYTALTMRKQQIYEIYHQPTGRIYRYKSGVYVFSNSTGTSKGSVLYLSRPMPVAGTGPYPAEALLAVAGQLYQAVRDTALAPPSAHWQLVDAGAAWPVYAHQQDVPSIVPLPGMIDAPGRGIELTEGLPDDLFALIRLEPLAAGAGMGLLTGTGGLREPVFEIRFKNRSTSRDYYSKRTGTPELVPGDLFPLTFFGNAGPEQKPAIDGVKAQLSPTGEIERIFSEIFI
jgi:hypothetical protein